jgi:hypothetical protein
MGFILSDGDKRLVGENNLIENLKLDFRKVEIDRLCVGIRLQLKRKVR